MSDLPGLHGAPAFQRGLQFANAHRLGDVIVHAGLQAFFAVAHQRVAGHGNDARALFGGPALADLARGFQAVHLRHLHIEEQDVVGLLLQRLEDFHAVVGEVSAITQLVQDAQADLLVDGIVIGQEQAQGQAAGEVGVERRRDGRFLLALDLDAQGAAQGVEQLRRADRFVDGDGNAGGQRARVVAARARWRKAAAGAA